MTFPKITSYGLAPTTTSAAVTTSESAPANVSSQLQVFLGRGVTRPFRRDHKGDFANETGAALVAAALAQILGTRASNEFVSGELPWRPEFGSLTYLLRHRKNRSTLRELGRAYIQQAVKRWEPRIRVMNVEVVEQSDRTLALRAVFDLIEKNVSGNNVILSGLELTIPVEA